MKRRLAALLLGITALLLLASCGAASLGESAGETVSFTDSCGREVVLPEKLMRVAPSGQTASMLLTALTPERMACLGSRIDKVQEKYFSAELAALPYTGHLYGGKSSINLEELLSTGAELVIDMGEKKDDIASELDALREQTGLPCVFIEADLPHMAEAFRTLGQLLGKEERAGELASLVEETLNMAREGAAKLPEGERLRVYFSTGTDPLAVNAAGSAQAQVLELVGAVNAVDTGEIVNKSGGTLLNMEQVYNFAPDVIVVGSDAAYAEVMGAETWAQLEAVKEGRVYLVPTEPYNWMAEPPSLNMLLGVWWLGNRLYPEVYDFDMATKAQELFRILWQYELSGAEAAEMVASPGA